MLSRAIRVLIRAIFCGVCRLRLLGRLDLISYGSERDADTGSYEDTGQKPPRFWVSD